MSHKLYLCGQLCKACAFLLPLKDMNGIMGKWTTLQKFPSHYINWFQLRYQNHCIKLNHFHTPQKLLKQSRRTTAAAAVGKWKVWSRSSSVPWRNKVHNTLTGASRRTPPVEATTFSSPETPPMAPPTAGHAPTSIARTPSRARRVPPPEGRRRLLPVLKMDWGKGVLAPPRITAKSPTELDRGAAYEDGERELENMSLIDVILFFNFLKRDVIYNLSVKLSIFSNYIYIIYS